MPEASESWEFVEVDVPNSLTEDVAGDQLEVSDAFSSEAVARRWGRRGRGSWGCRAVGVMLLQLQRQGSRGMIPQRRLCEIC